LREKETEKRAGEGCERLEEGWVEAFGSTGGFSRSATGAVLFSSAIEVRLRDRVNEVRVVLSEQLARSLSVFVTHGHLDAAQRMGQMPLHAHLMLVEDPSVDSFGLEVAPSQVSLVWVRGVDHHRESRLARGEHRLAAASRTGGSAVAAGLIADAPG